MTLLLLIIILIVVGRFILLTLSKGKRKLLEEKLGEIFPDSWRTFLKNNVVFYAQLGESDRTLFEKRLQLFLLTKNIEAVDTEIDDTIRLMVASSAIIPTFAFSQYNYHKFPYQQVSLVHQHSSPSQ